jgi:hypothetical protein
MDQAYTGLVPELLGIQKNPDAFLDGDGVPKTLPYDVTGWTLSLQIGVAATEIKDKIDPAEATKLAPVREAKHVGRIIGDGSATFSAVRRTTSGPPCWCFPRRLDLATMRNRRRSAWPS